MRFRENYAFLSNMYEAPMKANGLTFRCAEACFQSFKTLDIEERKKFQYMSGVEAKRYGKRVRLRSDWNTVRVEVMTHVVAAKFHQHPELAAKLKDIKDEIVEDNTWNDTFWGRCNGKGANNLGIILMSLRDTL